MQIKEKTKAEIESKISGMGDFLKMGYLEECLKHNLTFDVKKYCALELAKIYEARKMFSESGRKLEQAGEISITFREKKELFMKAAELYLKAEIYEQVSLALRKAVEQTNKDEAPIMKSAIKKLLREQAEVYENENRNGKALKAYEYLYKMLKESEKEEIKRKLLNLYEKLGKLSEYNILKGN